MIVLGVCLALAFDFMNGFHDAANSIATVVSTRVLSPRQAVIVLARSDDGSERTFEVVARLDGAIEVDYLRQGGILPAVLRRLAAD